MSSDWTGTLSKVPPRFLKGYDLKTSKVFCHTVCKV